MGFGLDQLFDCSGGGEVKQIHVLFSNFLLECASDFKFFELVDNTLDASISHTFLSGCFFITQQKDNWRE